MLRILGNVTVIDCRCVYYIFIRVRGRVFIFVSVHSKKKKAKDAHQREAIS